MRGYLGIDVGSISTNFVLLDEHKKLRFTSYVRASGSPIESVQLCMKQMVHELTDIEVLGVCTTGSGRELAGAVVGADVVKNEISAHARGALELHPDVQTVIEIGGQDSKVTILRDGAVVDFAMNLVCAAGTGSFLDSQARRLNMSIEELSEKSVTSTDPTAIAGRCTVFAESDMIHKQQIGVPQPDILMGLCHALARNFLTNVCRGKEILPPVMLQGGVSANLGIRRAFEEALHTQVIIPKYHMVMGAFGAALLAMDALPSQTKFRGVNVSEHHIRTRLFICEDCPNNCEIIEICDDDTVVGATGGRCGKW
ncbi:MAG: 2-hydroxyglutaryl-CoA dehydratase [Deltaproteobacteria bacterium]|nr:2-hydroxyglutaryl-CoA dehydratase [Deltaproteobacteria bacterium]MBN2671268.1 2-hydroxyglutaryl-CoA dehydratase [Deltaproteobacteria bacterium]